ncbi:hypothetical protein DAD186_18340 [Dermabacter vaginalis]|uniref:Uncharacterized protein n=1 Tax=Dermabacter vaginalis TaxID=1630135 RepID=A0A1B0ZK41_9MICO|nr:hypothetical protein DAD186_18340 [Dermabacter vaginalis]
MEGRKAGRKRLCVVAHSASTIRSGPEKRPFPSQLFCTRAP